MSNSNVSTPKPVVLFESQCGLQVQQRTSARTGNTYECVVLVTANREIILSLDRATVNDVKIAFLSCEV